MPGAYQILNKKGCKFEKHMIGECLSNIMQNSSIQGDAY